MRSDRYKRTGVLLLALSLLARRGYSARELSARLIRGGMPPETAEDYFAENIPSEEILENTEKMVIYRWNRHYPSDIRWEPDLAELGFALKETTEFPGTSHEKITREVYEK